MEQKQRREDVSRECLVKLRSNKAEFLRRFITTDETWVQHFIRETKEQSKQRTQRGESSPEKVKTISSTGKMTTSVFRNARKSDRIWRIRKSCFIKITHQSIFPSTMTKITQLDFETSLHTPYSPDLAPSDYFLVPNLIKWLGGNKFASNEEVQSEVDAYFETFEASSLNIAGKSVSVLKEAMLKNNTWEMNRQCEVLFFSTAKRIYPFLAPRLPCFGATNISLKRELNCSRLFD
ncbi:histone-lysine N-methyltransferase SETMAR-like [Euwallacea fornicatus]|uniref:histone-lysine N-methyltransferase SETMAR-like n=1 Tax=Euwallacea fornicatus TaxID=995702 RepID=UPI00338E6F09